MLNNTLLETAGPCTLLHVRTAERFMRKMPGFKNKNFHNQKKLNCYNKKKNKKKKKERNRN